MRRAAVVIGARGARPVSFADRLRTSGRETAVNGAVAACGVALVLRQILHAAATPGIDFVHIWRATHQLLAGAGAYHDPLFTYPPSSALVLAPVGALRYEVAKTLMLVVNVTAVVVATWLTLVTVHRRPSPRTIALTTLAVGALDAVGSTWANGNVNGVLVLLEVLAIRSMLASRWHRAAWLIGLTLAIKPVLFPVLIVFVLRRRWSATLMAAAIPAVLSGLGWWLIPDSGRFLHVVVPFLMHGAQLPFNNSFVGVGYLLRLDHVSVTALRVAVAVLTARFFVGRARDLVTLPSAADLVYVDIGVALAATFLIAPMSEAYYTIYLLPSLVWWAATHRSATAVFACLTVACFCTLRLSGIPGPVHQTTMLELRPSIGWLACLACLALPLRDRRLHDGAGGSRTPSLFDANEIHNLSGAR